MSLYKRLFITLHPFEELYYIEMAILYNLWSKRRLMQWSFICCITLAAHPAGSQTENSTPKNQVSKHNNAPKHNEKAKTLLEKTGSFLGDYYYLRRDYHLAQIEYERTLLFNTNKRTQNDIIEIEKKTVT